MTASLVSSSSNTSKLLNNVLTTASSTSSGISVAQEALAGVDFGSALSALFKNQADAADQELKKIKQQAQEKLDDIKQIHEKVDTELVTDKQLYQDILNAKAEARQQASKLDEWKILEVQPASDYSVLEKIGDGLLTAAKIAGAILAL